MKIIDGFMEAYNFFFLLWVCDIYENEFNLQVWLVGEGLEEEEQDKAAKGTIFIPFSTFPPNKIRNDCFYHYTPAMLTPLNLQNMHTCEVSNQLDYK